MLVADTWAQTTPHPDISAQRFESGALPSTGVAADGNVFGNHGFWVAGLLGADVNGIGSSGTAFNAPAALDILSVQVGQLSFPDVIRAIESAAPATGSFIINASIGYNDPDQLNETRAARALYALQWRVVMQRLGADRVLVVAAAGNDGDAATPNDATLSSPMTTQALVPDLSVLIDAADQALWARVEAQAALIAPPKLVVGSSLVVGASNSSRNRASFSTPGEQVLMPGVTLGGPCVVNGGSCVAGEMIDNGTSGAAPLASGVAAMAWGLAPSLSAAEVREILVDASGAGVIDAYDVLWATLARSDNSPLDVFVDVDASGVFDEADVNAALVAWDAAEQADPDVSIAPRDWSRFDLNGDGFTRTDTAIAIDLDGDGLLGVETNPTDIGLVTVTFDENGVNDLDLLCLASYSSAYDGDVDVRDAELLERCSSDVPTGFVRIEPGTFTMGSPTGELGRIDGETQHTVTLTRAFLLQVTEVTQGQYESLMGVNPSFFSGCGADCPAETVNWYDAVAYANALSVSEGLPACYDDSGEVVGGTTVYDCLGYRLPTESEWEYAARAGTTTATYLGDLEGDPYSCDPQPSLDSIAWFCGNSEDQTHSVGSKAPNAWGLYDMLGNVWEWTSDWHGDYPGTVTDPVGPSTGSYRVLRGGSWYRVADRARAADRGLDVPGGRYNFGFRLARSLP